MPNTISELTAYLQSDVNSRNTDYFIDETNYFLLNANNISILLWFAYRAAKEQDQTRVLTIYLQQSGGLNPTLYTLSITNADLQTLVEDVMLYMQQSFDAQKAVLVLINNNTITDFDGIDSAWPDAVTTAEGVARTLHTVTLDDFTSGTTNKAYTAADDAKLAALTSASAISDAATNASTSASAASVTILGISVPTNSSYVALVAAYNDLATKHNDLATKVNTLFYHLRSQGLQS